MTRRFTRLLLASLVLTPACGGDRSSEDGTSSDTGDDDEASSEAETETEVTGEATGDGDGDGDESGGDGDGDGDGDGAFTDCDSPPSPTIVVNSTGDDENDDDVTTLREAIALANADPDADVITFDATVFASSSTIELGSVLEVSSALTIVGPGESELAIDGQGATQLLSIDAGGDDPEVTVGLGCLTLQNGFVNGHGGALTNREHLSLQSVTVTGNSATSSGGGFTVQAESST